MRTLRSYLSGKGNVVATGYAAFLAVGPGHRTHPSRWCDSTRYTMTGCGTRRATMHCMGIPCCTTCSEESTLRTVSVDRILPIVSYDGDRLAGQREGRGGGEIVRVPAWRAEGCRGTQARSRAAVLSLGGMIAFAPANHLRANLEQFMENALLYTAGTTMPGPVTFWEKMGSCAHPGEDLFASASPHLPPVYWIQHPPVTFL